MDPLSITSASVALAAAVYKCAIEVKRIVGTFADAVDSLSDLAEEVQLIQGALQGVEDALHDNRDAISRYKVEEVFSIAVKGCRATLACIKQEFDLLFNRNDWKARFMMLWKEDDIKKLLGRLDRKRESILLLLQLLSLSSVREVQSLVAEKHGALTVAKEDIAALIPTYWSCRDTIIDSLDKETVDSIFADRENRESKLSATEFDFDYELINTRAYRRALVQTQRNEQLPPRKEPNAAAQVLGSGSLEQVEDLIDLNCEPSLQTASMPSNTLSQSYTDLLGLDFMPITVQEGSAHAGSPAMSHTAKPRNRRGIDNPLEEFDLSLNLGEVPQDKSSRDWPQVQHAKRDGGMEPSSRKHRHKATKSQTSLPKGYLKGVKEGQKHPGVRVRLTPSKSKRIEAKHQPEVTGTSQNDFASNIPSDELLDSSLIGSSNPPKIGDSNSQRTLVDIEIDRSRRRRRRASPLVPTENHATSSESQPCDSRDKFNNNLLHSQNHDRRARPKQSKRTQTRQNTQASTALSINNPKLLPTVEEAIRRQIYPEIKALKREMAEWERREENTRRMAKEEKAST